MVDKTEDRLDQNALRSLLVGGVSLFALAPAAALAQDTSADPEEIEEAIEEAEEEDRIVVTGSRIRRSEFTSISPIQVISGEVSRDLGIVDAQDILNQTSVVQGQQTTIGLSTVLATGQAFTTFGSVTPSLRGLSSSVTGRTRNLILINGRRYGPIGVGGAPANPDVSLIPGSLLQRVDILLDGASSVYGSDAIAGVINYVLRDDFEGLEVDGFYTTPQLGVGDQFVISATWGITSDNGFALIAGEFNEQNGLRRSDRFPTFAPFIATDFGNVICDPEREINTNTGEIFSGCSSFLSDFAVFGPTGTTIVTPGESNIGVPGFSRLGVAPFDGPDSNGTFGGINNPFTRSFPTDQEEFLRPPTQRFSIYSLGEYRVPDLYTSPTFYYETSYAERTLQTFSTNQGVLEVTGDTVFNPGIGAALLVPQLQFEIEQNIDVFRVTGGVRGDLPFLNGVGSLDNWTYDTYGLFHRSRGTQSTFGDLSNNNVARVLNGTTDPDTGQFTCALDETLEGQQPSRAGPGGGFTTPITNCDAVNFFDPLFLTTGRFADPFANDFILTTAIQNTTVDQFTTNGFITGDLYTIPFGGTVSAVLGFEYRTDIVNTVNDENQSTSNALATLNPDVGSSGQRRIVEGFAELSIPILKDQFLVDSLQVDLAIRYTEEQFFGSAVTWQAKGEYRPVDWLSFAGGYGTSFRAPDTGEQFGTGIIFANNVRVDPCLPPVATLVTSDGTNNPPGVPDGVVFFDITMDGRIQSTVDLCTALGVTLPSGPLDADGAAALGLFGIGTPSASFQNFSVLFGNDGNVDIDPETSRAFFAKVSFDQPWFDGFNLRISANYFDYLVEGSIGQLTAGTILAACFDPTQNPPAQVVNGILEGDLCSFATRSPTTGLLTAINEASFNLGSLTSTGIDFNLEADADLTFLGFIPGYDNLNSPINLGLVYRATYQIENDEDITGNGTFNERAGFFGFPEYQHNITTSLRYDRFSLNHRVFYTTMTDDGIGPFGGGNVCIPMLLARDPNADTSGCTEFIDLPPVILHDITASYNADTWAFRVGVRNVLNTVIIRDTAIPGDGNSGTPFGLGFDVDGRNFFVNLTKRF